MINIVASICTFLTYLYLAPFFLPKVTPLELCFYNFVSRVFHFISIYLSISICLFVIIFELYENGTVCIVSYVLSFFHFIVVSKIHPGGSDFLLSLIYNIPVCSYYTIYLPIPLLMYILGLFPGLLLYDYCCHEFICTSPGEQIKRISVD